MALVLYPLITALIDAQDVINQYRHAVPQELLDARNKLAMQVAGFIFLYLFLLVVLYYLNEQPNQQQHTPALSDEEITDLMKDLDETLDEAKFKPMIKTLITKYRNQSFLNPELQLGVRINEKMAQGKTREQAIEELYKQE